MKNDFYAQMVRRPVAVTLLTLGLTLLGIVCFRLLSVSSMPQVEMPAVYVSASMPGASPETMASTIATPLERALGSIAGITEMTSVSSLSSTRIIIQFDLSRNIDDVAREVQAAINSAATLLPTGMPRNPTYRKANPANAPVLTLSLTSATKTVGELYDIAATVLAQRISQVEGTGDVTVSGASLPAVRVDLNLGLLEQYGISTDVVRHRIASSNANRPKGMIEEGDRQWIIGANDQLSTAEQYRQLIISYRDGAPIRLDDIADVVDSVQDVYNAGMYNGKPAVHIMVRTQADANLIATVDKVMALVPSLRAALPASAELTVTMDRTPVIRSSLREVEQTLLISVLLVAIMVYIFLRSARATLIPMVVVPVSLVSSAIALYLCGFTLNNLTLMALTVGTGFVVDDAIVVIENVSRHREMGKSRMVAAVDGVREVGPTVVTMSLSLITAFIPILLMSGVAGRFMRQFAITVAGAVLVSMLVALTTVPMLCAHLLKPDRRQKHGALYHSVDRFIANLKSGYAITLERVLLHRRLVLFVFFGIVAFNIYLYAAIPSGLVPRQDLGRISAYMRADESISFQAMKEKYERIMQIVQADPAVDMVTGYTGGRQRNRGSMAIQLKPRSEREATSIEVIQRLQKQLAKESGIRLFMTPVQEIRMGGREADAEFQYTLQSDDIAELNTWVPRLRRLLATLPEITDVSTDDDDHGLQTMVKLDRDAIARLGLTVAEVDTALNNAFGQRQVSTIYNDLNQYHVVMEASDIYTAGPQTLNDFNIISSDGKRVPLAAFARFAQESRSLSVRHQGQFIATTIAFNLAPGYSLSQAMEAINYAVLKEGLPVSIIATYQGTAKLYKDTLNDQLVLLVAALLGLYIILGILYESYSNPLVIISSLPCAGIGALLGLIVCNSEFTLIALLGIMMLIGLVMKNAIMMVDFALTAQRQQGLSPQDAIFQAALLRFRPILMTSMTALLAAVPLVVANGDGSELRRPMGIAVIGGLIASQLLTLYTTPVIYLAMNRVQKRVAETGSRFWQTLMSLPGAKGEH